MRQMISKFQLITLLVLLGFISEIQAEPLVRQATGVVQAKRTVTLASKIMGRVKKIHVDESSVVKKNMLLLQLDDAELRADLASAEASFRLATAERSYKRKAENRVKKLTSTNVLAQERLDDAQFAHTAAREKTHQSQAAIAKTKSLLKETRLHAPFAGVITLKNVEIGQLTQPGVSLFVLEDHTAFKIRAKIKEQDIAHIKKGQQVAVTIDALDKLILTGKVKRIIPSGDAETHAFSLDVVLPAHKDVMPGMFARLEFSSPSPQSGE